MWIKLLEINNPRSGRLDHQTGESISLQKSELLTFASILSTRR